MTERRFVVDASVAAKWYLKDEEAAEPAASLLLRFQEGEMYLIAPSVISYEVPRSIQRAVKRGRIGSALARQAVRDFNDLPLPTISAEEILLAAFDLAIDYGCSFYDACYLALADLLGVPLISADDRLQRQLAGRVDYLVTLDHLELPE